MFINQCAACRRQSAHIPQPPVSSYDTTSRGLEAHYTCWCGAEQTWLASPAVQSRLVAA